MKNNLYKPQIVLGGAFSTGKTSVVNGVKSRLGGLASYVGDGARTILEEMGRPVESLSEQERKEFQMQVFEEYLRQETSAQADPNTRVVISDGSLLEALAYSELVGVQKTLLNALKTITTTRRQVYTIIHLPTQHIQIENDSLRHTSEEYQQKVDETIRRLQGELGFVSFDMKSHSIEARVKEVLAFIGIHRNAGVA